MTKTTKIVAIAIVFALLLTSLSLAIFLPNSTAKAESQSPTVLTMDNAGTVATLKAMLTENPSGNFVLGEDLDMGNSNLVGAIDFSGTLDGQGYSIKNFNINYNSGSDNSYNSYIFQSNSGTIENISFVYTMTALNNNKGCIVLTNTGTIQNVLVDCTLAHTQSGEYYQIGGLTHTNNGNIKNVVAKMTINSGVTIATGKDSTWTVGVITSYNSGAGVLENCYWSLDDKTGNYGTVGYAMFSWATQTNVQNLNADGVTADFSADNGWSSYWVVESGVITMKPASKFYMNKGVELRTDNRKGLRFTATIEKAQMQSWLDDGYEVQAGMVIMPYDYVATYGEISQENLFGENAIYSGTKQTGKTKVLDLVTKYSDMAKTGNGNYLVRGSIAEIKDANLERDFTARAYAKLTKDSQVTYVFASYNENDMANSTADLHSTGLSAYNSHLATESGLYSSATIEWLVTTLEKVAPLQKDIVNLAVYKKYQADGMTGETGSYPLAWCGETEDDRANIFAWYDFEQLFNEITGKTLEISYVSNISELSSSTNYFVLGGDLALQAGLTYDGITTDNGHKISKRDGNLYLYGKSGYGTANAMYAFLNQAFGAEFFSDTLYTTTDTTFLYSEIEEVTFNPSIDYSWTYDGLLFRENGTEINYAYQMRLGYTNYWQILGGNIHGFETVFPKDTYSDYYYTYNNILSTDDDVLDLNSAGEINTSNTMVRAVADWLYNQIMYTDDYGRYSSKTVYAFGPSDKRYWSKSSASTANLTTYGANSGEYLLFMNAVVKLLNTDSAYADIRDVDVMMMAYNEVLAAPTSNLEALAIDTNPARGVSLKVMFAPIEMNMNDSPTSTVTDFYGNNPTYYYGEYAKWQNIFGADNVYFWRYSIGYNDFFVPMNVYEHMQSNYQAIVGDDNYIGHVMEQGANKSSAQTNFAALSVYLRGQLGKNVNVDINALTEKFFKAYYGETAGATMLNLLKAEQTHLNKVKEGMSASKDSSGCHWLQDDIYQSKWWGANCSEDNGAMLKEWYGYVTTALSQTSNVAEQNRIKVEALNIRYISLKTYGSVFDGDSLAQLESDAIALGVTQWTEGKGIEYLDGVVE